MVLCHCEMGSGPVQHWGPNLDSVDASQSHGEEIFELLMGKINFINNFNCTRTGEHRYFPSSLEMRRILKAMPVMSLLIIPIVRFVTC